MPRKYTRMSYNTEQALLTSKLSRRRSVIRDRTGCSGPKYGIISRFQNIHFDTCFIVLTVDKHRLRLNKLHGVHIDHLNNVIGHRKGRLEFTNLGDERCDPVGEIPDLEAIAVFNLLHRTWGWPPQLDANR
jgi:hypothetical protein